MPELTTGTCAVARDEVTGIVRLTMSGHPTAETMRAAFARLHVELAHARPRLFLVDGTAVPGTTNEMRAVISEEAKTLDIDRQAIVGIRPSERVLARILVRLTGRADRLNFFAAEAEAVRWLMELRG